MRDPGQTARPSSDCILYDGSCGFCSRWVQFWGPTLSRRNIAIAELQEPWVADELKLRSDELLDDIRLVTRDGQLVNGGDVLSVRHSPDLVGVAFLRHLQPSRLQFSAACGLSMVCPQSLPLLAYLWAAPNKLSGDCTETTRSMIQLHASEIGNREFWSV